MQDTIMTEPSNENERRVIALGDSSKQIQQDLRLSLGQTQSLPDMLMTAPLAINLLGQIKLLAFSDNALRINLRKPEAGFQHLRYTSFSSAMIQIVDQASDAFDSASKNMGAIRLRANLMFETKNSHISSLRNTFSNLRCLIVCIQICDILECLKDPQVAKSSLMKHMDNFRREMRTCADYAQKIEGQFDKLVSCAREANEAMADEMNASQEEDDKIEVNARKVEAEVEIQKNAVKYVQGLLGDAKKDYDQNRELFVKQAKKGEWSALAFGSAADVQAGAAGLVNALVGIVKEAPKLAIETVRAVGNICSGTSSSQNDNQQTTQVGPQQADVGIDPGLLAAEQIEAQLLYIRDLLDGDVADILKAGGYEITACIKRLESLNANLEGFRSKHTFDARGFLRAAIDVLSSIVNQEGSSATVKRGQKQIELSLKGAIKLRSFAAAQPGHGFGGTLEEVSGVSGSSSYNTGYTKVLKARHEKLLIMRTAMKEAQENLNRTSKMQLSAQSKLIELAKSMKDLEHKKATIQETKTILRKAIDAMMAMQQEVRNLTRFFNMLAESISIIGMGHAERYLSAIEGGMRGDGENFTIMYSKAQVQSIRETVFLLRGHFDFVIKSADLYQQISKDHIYPSIREAANLPISATPEAQAQAQAKLRLETMTNKSAEAIKSVAEEQYQSLRRELEQRCRDIEAEMATLPALDFQADIEVAIVEGVQESAKEMAESTTQRKLDDDFGDDL